MVGQLLYFNILYLALLLRTYIKSQKYEVGFKHGFELYYSLIGLPNKQIRKGRKVKMSE